MTEQKKTDFIVTQIKTFTHNNVTSLIVDGSVVCKTYFLFCYGFSEQKWKRCKNIASGKQPSHRKKQVYKAEKQLDVDKFMEHLIVVCEKMPHKNEVNMPCDYTWKLVHQAYKERSSLRHPAKYSTFLDRVARSWSHVKIAANNDLGLCDICNDNKELIFGLRNRQPLTMDQLEARKKHLADQGGERNAYYGRCILTGRMPNIYISMIMDGMQPKKLPLKVPSDKSILLLKRFKLNITGTISHGEISDKLSFYVSEKTRISGCWHTSLI